MCNEKNRAALFFDIDGTILSNITGKIPESALKAIEQAGQNGHLLFVNTGRTWAGLPREIAEAPFNGFLCGCGTHLIYQGAVLFSSTISARRGVEILDKLEECNIEGLCEGQEDIYFSRKKSRFAGVEKNRIVFAGDNKGLRYYQEDRNFTYDKLYLITDADSNIPEFLDFIAEDMEAIDRGNGRYEVIQKGYDKATACDFILKKFKIPKERCYVFGDSSNDLAMFQFATHAIAMGEHSAVLDPYTEFVTKTVEEDGIAHALKHYGLI